MLPTPAEVPKAPAAILPSLPLSAEALAAARSRAASNPLQDAMGVEPVPARLTPRGSLVALAAMPAEAQQDSSDSALEMPAQPPPRMAVATAGKVALGQGNDSQQQHLLRVRAESAEQELRKLRMENKKLEGEVRKVRADAYFSRIGKNVQGPRGMGEKAQETDQLASAKDASEHAWTARLLAEERAVKAETEVLRLHTELQAARIQFTIMSEGATTTAPAPDKSSGLAAAMPDYAVFPCCRYVCGCLRFSAIRLFLACCCCLCCKRSSIQHVKMKEPRSEMLEDGIKRGFCVVDRA